MNSYSREFQAIKVKEEKPNLLFPTESNEAYDQTFRRTKLEDAVRKVKLTFSGQDGISKKMIRDLPEKAMQYMLYMFNRCYKEGYFLKK